MAGEVFEYVYELWRGGSLVETGQLQREEPLGEGGHVSARDAAHGIVLSSPFRAEIEKLDASALERATTAAEQALSAWDDTYAPMSARIATATF